MSSFKCIFIATIIFLYTTTGTSGGELSGGGIKMASLNEAAHDTEQEKQSKAKKLFKSMTAEQAVESDRFYKVYPRFYFPDADKWSYMHDDCITDGFLFGGYYRKCIDYSSEINECLETEITPLLIAEEDSPTSVKVIFYRKSPDLDLHNSNSTKFRLGSKNVRIRSCD